MRAKEPGRDTGRPHCADPSRPARGKKPISVFCCFFFCCPTTPTPKADAAVEAAAAGAAVVCSVSFLLWSEKDGIDESESLRPAASLPLATGDAAGVTAGDTAQDVRCERPFK